MRPQHQVPHEEASVGQELRQLAKLAAPFALAQAGQSMMGLVDTAVVGRLNAASLAAVSVENSIFFTVSILGIGLLFGLDPLISQAVGAEVKGRARLLLWQGVWLALAGALPAGCGEVMVHPGYITDVTAAETRLLQERLTELEALCDPAVREALAQREVTLSAFGSAC